MEIKSTIRGFLPPRMTANQKELINNPVVGLTLFCTDCCSDGNLIFYNGDKWLPSITDTICADFDLDGDNDGILDENEEELIVNGQLTNSIDGWTVTNNVVHSTWLGLNGMQFGGGVLLAERLRKQHLGLFLVLLGN